mmetsp:Transcript_14570/g.24922  ORF Transcript_14570/g.24922 Transcript_14570/m.24922 type:complete len:426 (-) Transcript_14570:44-1321(-)
MIQIVFVFLIFVGDAIAAPDPKTKMTCTSIYNVEQPGGVGDHETFDELKLQRRLEKYCSDATKVDCMQAGTTTATYELLRWERSVFRLGSRQFYAAGEAISKNYRGDHYKPGCDIKRTNNVSPPDIQLVLQCPCSVPCTNQLVWDKTKGVCRMYGTRCQTTGTTLSSDCLNGTSNEFEIDCVNSFPPFSPIEPKCQEEICCGSNFQTQTFPTTTTTTTNTATRKTTTITTTTQTPPPPTTKLTTPTTKLTTTKSISTIEQISTTTISKNSNNPPAITTTITKSKTTLKLNMSSNSLSIHSNPTTTTTITSLKTVNKIFFSNSSSIAESLPLWIILAAAIGGGLCLLLLIGAASLFLNKRSGNKDDFSETSPPSSIYNSSEASVNNEYSAFPESQIRDLNEYDVVGSLNDTNHYEQPNSPFDSAQF